MLGENVKGIIKDMNITFWEDVKGQAILGADDFVEEIRDGFDLNNEADLREIPALKELARKPVVMETIALEVASRFGVEEKDLYLRK